MNFPLSCGLTRFQNIYNDLSKFPLPNYDRIIIRQDPLGYYPATAKKGTFVNPIDKKVAECTLSFFETNFTHISNVTDAASFFIKFTPAFYSNELKKRFKNICIRIFQGEMIEGLELMRIQIFMKAKEDCEKSIEGLKQEILFLENKKVNMNNTIILCQESEEIYTHFNLLEKIPFFRGYNDSGMKKIASLNISEAKAKKYPHIFDFSDFNKETIYQFLDWINNPISLERLMNYEHLFELCRLADYLCENSFRTACINHLKNNITDYHLLNILSLRYGELMEFIIDHCCQWAAKRFIHLASDPGFLKIKHEFLIKILTVETLRFSEIEIFKAVLKWAGGQQEGALNVLIKGKSLLDCIRFQHINKTDFLEYKKYLPKEDWEKWYEFHLQDRMVSAYRCSSLGFQAHFEKKQIEIQWEIPMEDYKRMLEKPGYDARNDQSLLGRSFVFSQKQGKIALYIFDDNPDYLAVRISLPREFHFHYLAILDSFQQFVSPVDPHDEVKDHFLMKTCYFPKADLKFVDCSHKFVFFQCLVFFDSTL